MRLSLLNKIFVLSLTLFFASNSAGQSFDSAAKEAIMVDLSTGTVIYEKNADERAVPSSMSKLMTLYVIFDRLKNGSLKLDDTFRVSEKAWKMQGSKSFLPVNSEVKIEDLIRSIIVHSGNDSCVVVAEGISGSEEKFSEELNKYGAKLGLTGSHFANSTGWPDENHYMTMRDIAKLTERLIKDFPEYYHYFAETEFKYNNIKQPNRNVLLTKDTGVDGLKTGHTDDAGYGISLSAIREGRRLVAVINGLPSMAERAKAGELLLDYGFREFRSNKLFANGEVVGDAEVWFGKSGVVPLVLNQDVILTLNNSAKNNIKAKVKYSGPVEAPIKKGDEIAKLFIEREGLEPIIFPLSAGADVKELSFFSHIIKAAKIKIAGHKKTSEAANE